MWAGVSKVIIAHHDPNPTVRGDGCRVLREASIPTQTGLMEEEADQIRAFMHWCTHRRPLVTVKLALDAQGSVDDRSAEAQRFTSAGCLEKVHELPEIVTPYWLAWRRSTATTPNSMCVWFLQLGNPFG